jgi:hypothetical protein
VVGLDIVVCILLVISEYITAVLVISLYHPDVLLHAGRIPTLVAGATAIVVVPAALVDIKYDSLIK